MRELNLERVAVGTTKLHFIRAIGIIRWRSARTPTAKLDVWAAMRSHEGRGALAIAKKVTLKQNLMVLGGLRNQIRIMPDYPLRRFLPDFGPRPSSWGLSFGAHRFPNAPQPGTQSTAGRGSDGAARRSLEAATAASGRDAPDRPPGVVKEDAAEPAT
jgi:hypothetical protein